MLVADLHQHRHSKKRAKTSSRKHEGVRTPSARNAIVKSRESGAYQANTDVTLSETESLKLRVNALELEVSRLKREGSVAAGHAAPLVQEGNVVPMDVARTARTEKESAAQVSHPLPVAGNEALALPSPSTEPEGKEFRKNFEPTLVGKVDTIASRAANDEDVHPPEVGEKLAEISHLDSESVAQLADAYGMDVVEASEILYKEYSKREKQCYKDHGLPRDDVQLTRLMRQRGQCVVGDGNYGIIHWIPTNDCDSNFAAWWGETEARMKNLRSEATARQAREYRSPANHAPLVKGEAKYRRKVLVNRLASERQPNRAGFSRVQDVNRKLYVDGPGVTTASQWAAITTVAWAGYQKMRKLFRMQPTVRGMNQRVRAELVTDLEASGNADLEKKFGIVPAADAEQLPMRDLVRRYQRAGIV